MNNEEEQAIIDNYPVICFRCEQSNQKVFLIPSPQVLKDLGRKEKDHASQLQYGSHVLTQLFEHERKLSNTEGQYTIYEYKRTEQNKTDPASQLLDFEKKTLLSSKDYDMYFLMDSSPLDNLSIRDKDVLTNMTMINQHYKTKKTMIN